MESSDTLMKVEDEESSESEGLDAIINPIFNQLVLDKIFSYLPLQDILSCRATCRDWYFHSSLKKKIHECLELNFGEDLSNSGNHLKRLSKFNDVMRKSSWVPFIKFSLCYIPVKEPILEEFFEICGPSMKYIKLRMSKKDMNIFDFSELLVKNLPVLHTLEIAGLSNRAVFSQKLFPEYDEVPQLQNLKCLILQETRVRIINFLVVLFRASVNLEEIIITSDTRRDWDNQSGIMNSHSPATASVLSALIYANKNICKLKRLKFEILDRSNINVLINLAEQGMRLNSLEMKGVANDCDADIFETFLSTQQKCLQMFFTFQPKLNTKKKALQDKQPFRLSMPSRMHALKVIQLSYRQKDQSLPVFPISYSSQLPNLQVLIIHGWAPLMNLNDYFSHSHNRTPHLSLRELILPGGIEDDDFPSILSQIFPKVIKLEIISCSNGFLQCLWKSWPKLEILKLTAAPDVNLDSGFTGISHKVCESVLHNSDMYDHLDGKKAEERSAISNLKCLRRLVIIIQVEETEINISTITDVTGYYAFAKMEHLRWLQIISTNWYEGVLTKDCSGISTECCKELKSILSNTCVFIGDETSDK